MKIESYKLSSSSSDIEEKTWIFGSNHVIPYLQGTVGTLWGYVRVYAEKDGYKLQFIWQGRCYVVEDRYAKLPSKKALANRASRFARKVVEESGNGSNH